jgi:hypothetical protein
MYKTTMQAYYQRALNDYLSSHGSWGDVFYGRPENVCNFRTLKLSSLENLRVLNYSDLAC